TLAQGMGQWGPWNASKRRPVDQRNGAMGGEGLARARARCDLLACPVAAQLRHERVQSDGLSKRACWPFDSGLPLDERRRLSHTSRDSQGARHRPLVYSVYAAMR